MEEHQLPPTPLRPPRARTPDSSQQHYDWLTGYLAVRGWVTPVRFTLAVLTLLMTVCVAALLISPDGPRAPIQVTMAVLSMAGGLCCALIYLRRWPTRRQSMVYAVVFNAATAMICLAYPEPLPALVGCIAFATLAAYVAFFHSWRLVIYNFAVALVVSVTAAVRVALEGRLALALTDLWLVLQINLIMPAAILVLVRALGGDLLAADRDHLTGLFNRRAFRDKTVGLLVSRNDGEHHFAVAVIDLDDFKSVNDTYGHSAGDIVLIQAASALRAAAPRAIVARSGGEEFVVAAVAETDEAAELGERLRAAVAFACRDERVTASVGVCTSSLRTVADGEFAQLIDDQAAAADAAMYRAKRAGGDKSQVCDHA